EGTLAFSRLTAFAGTNNGFELAEADLQLRSEGNVLGQAQSGRASSLKFLQVMADGALLEQARIMADEFLQKDPNLQGHPELAAILAQMEQRQEAEYLVKS
ncbi:MAG: ATP-dependent DNA helicase RecG, partial [Arcanobacterium sp.]|nr:ATP-dependent DNA helicase RecG [Arcanobacterium sp.]